jgi:Zn finger protein HypA/HybF involved in hydrogenase expression
MSAIESIFDSITARRDSKRISNAWLVVGRSSLIDSHAFQNHAATAARGYALRIGEHKLNACLLARFVLANK